jgi:nucleoside-diphosphate-sugar epimerase
MSRLIIWGTGELGLRVALRWMQTGQPVFGFTKSTERHSNLKAAGIEPATGSPETYLGPDDCLLLSIPGHTNQQAAVEQLRQAQVAVPARSVFISVTGYYGAASGLIRVNSPPGEGSRSASIVAAEQTFQDWSGNQGVVLRLGGLYSQTRGPFAALARRRKITRRAPADKTMALIHYEDAATAVAAALQHPDPDKVYLGVTPPCPTREEFYSLACEVLDLPLPDFDPPTGLAPAEFDVTSLRRDLLPEPQYPDWRMGLTMPP